MRLSEAIWLGSKLKKQTFGLFSRIIHFKDKHTEIRTCALGAALDAFGRLGGAAEDECFPEIILPVCRIPTFCPACSERIHDMVGARVLNVQIAHLNDMHKWSRERIASWVAEIEAQNPQLPGAVTGTPEPVEEVAVAEVSQETSRGFVA